MVIARLAPILLTLCLVPTVAVARTIPVSIDLVPEDETIDSSTLYCGLIEIENTGQDRLEIRLPFYSERNFKWEVRYSGETVSVETPGYVLGTPSNPVRAGLSPGEKVTIPFALMYHQDTGFLFERPGEYEVRAIATFRGHAYATSWKSVYVRRTNYSARWRNAVSSGNWLMALYPMGKTEELVQFGSTQGFDNWLVYVAFDIRTNTAKNDRQEWGLLFPEELNQSLQGVLAGKSPGAPCLSLWKAISEDGGRGRRQLYSGSEFVLWWH